MLKPRISKKNVFFEGESLQEDLMFADAKRGSGEGNYNHRYQILEKGNENTKLTSVDAFNWHTLVTKSNSEISVHPILQYAERWGLEFGGLAEAEHTLASKRATYEKEAVSLEEYKETPKFQKALEQVKNCFGHTFSDGSKMFDYQLDSAAYILGRKRILLSLDMGLGKTRTTLVGLASDPKNERILIVTMSRNINDWIREIKTIGLENDFIVLESPIDMKSSKRIHLVSYEKWAKESIVFKEKVVIEECPYCNHRYDWHKQLQYCTYCNERHVATERYSEKELPEECPCCESEWKNGSLFCKCGYTVVKQRKKALYKFFNRSYDAAAVDEAHKIKNGQTNRSRAVRAIKTKYRVALSGTPAENGADDLFWPLTWVSGDSHHFEDPFEFDKFKGFGRKGEEHFRVYYGGSGQRALLDANSIQARASNQEKLWSLLDKFMIRKKKTDKDVEAEIHVPAPIHRRIHLSLDVAERQLYDKRLEEFRTWYMNEQSKKIAAETRGAVYRISTIEVCSWLDKLRKAASCPWYQEDYDMSLGGEPVKLRTVKEKVIEYARKNKKLLIFTAHKNTAEQLGTILDSVVPGKRAGFIHGSIPMAYRYKLMDEFQDPNSSLSVLVMTARTGSESYTLTEAKGVVLYDLEFNAKQIEQCYSRAVRLGQKDEVEVSWLIGVDTIDANMHALVLSKQSGVDLAIDRQELDMDKISKEFETDGSVEVEPGVDYLAFASEMLTRGNKRTDYVA
ncbi:MAG: DEAD/DEAH box helicase [Psychrobacillus sp.]